MSTLRCLVLGFVLALNAGGGWAGEAAELMPLVPVRSLVLDIAETSSRAVAVGERGHILLSESRSEWRQAEGVPTRATLTAVTAVGRKAWAVGHDGTILASEDGGLSWSLQREEIWTREGFDSPDWTPRYAAPLLDVLFVDENHGFAVGAYSLLLRTADGGATWEVVELPRPSARAQDNGSATGANRDSWTFSTEELELEEEDDPHLNAIARTPSGLLLIVGERGAAFRSVDGGQQWERLSLPYEGSMFGVIALGEQHLLAFGLRGHVLETTDGGSSWRQVETGTELSLMGGAALANGGAVVVGANGVVLYRESAEAAFELHVFKNAAEETPVLSAVFPLGQRTFLLAGETGIDRYEIPVRPQ